jgi:predicted small metal-binding protein
MTRTVFDCARVPGETCSIQISGERDDVLQAAQDHLVSAHGLTEDGKLEQNVKTVVDEHRQTILYGSWMH